METLRQATLRFRALKSEQPQIVQAPCDLPVMPLLVADPSYEWGQAFGIQFKKNRRALVRTIIRAVCDHYKLSLTDMLSRRKTKGVIRPRQVAIYLAKELTLASLPEIGRVFDRDHTTILHAVRAIPVYAENDPKLAEDIARLRAGLESTDEF
jgi:hypothetical protein